MHAVFRYWRPRHEAGLLCGVTIAAALCLPRLAGAADDLWALCPAPKVPVLSGEQLLPGEDQERTILRADEATTKDSEAIFSGDVQVQRPGKELKADEATYNKNTDTVDVTGNVQFRTQNFTFQAEQAQMNLSEDSGTLENAHYFIPELHASGTADHIQFEGTRRTSLEGATYSTCPPQKEDWRLKAGRIRLDRDTNTGEAYNVTLAFKGVPFIYLPYMNFPLAGRKSGFLAPTYGNSSLNGTDLSVPYYWNIAPNQDATITPRYIQKRGMMAMTEYRYLTRYSSGSVNYDVLPNDKLYRKTWEEAAQPLPSGVDPDQSNRYYLRLNHRHQLTNRWGANLAFQEVSDPFYFSDLQGNLSSTSITHLERHFDLTYHGAPWNFLGRVQDYQTLVPGQEPYRRVPQLLLAGNPLERNWHPHYTFRGEYVDFQNSGLGPTGARADVYPGLSFPMGGAAWFFKPRAAFRYTQYNLDYAGTAPPGSDSTPQRALPIYSLDTGLYFDRNARLGDTQYVQTLEPRLYYLRVPYRDQSNLPLFDTGAMTFSFDQMFRENRFTGPDRVGDANQLTAAITTRFLDGVSGRELGHLSFGQIAYFANRRVTLSGQPEERHSSDIVGELAASPIPEMMVSASGRWNPEQNYAEQVSALIGYRKNERQQVTAAYSLTDAGQVSNTDLVALWPISRRWHFIGRWYYDRVEERSLETVVGLEYESCCWSLRVAGRSRPLFNVDGTVESSEHTIYLMLQLKGLANIGPGLDSMIKEGILGYR